MANTIIEKIHAAQHLDELFAEIKHDLVNLFAVEQLTLYEVDREKRELYSKYLLADLHGVLEIHVPINESSVPGYCARYGKILNITDAYNRAELAAIHPRLSFNQTRDALSGFHTRQMLAVPILVERRYLMGVLLLLNKRNGERFTSEEEGCAMDIAETFGLALRRMALAQPPRMMAFARTPQPYLFTVEEYLAFERASDERHEYLNGVIYAMAGSASPLAMAGESADHGTICTNLGGVLCAQLRGTPCRAFSKDTKVRCSPYPYRPHRREGLCAYPDLVVVCGPSQYHDQARDVVLNPTVLVEVLSPSTEDFDRGGKLYRYHCWLPTLTDYVLVAQDRPVMNHYQRTTTGQWELETLAGLDAHLHLPSIACTVPLADVYERIVFPASAEEGHET